MKDMYLKVAVFLLLPCEILALLSVQQEKQGFRRAQDLLTSKGENLNTVLLYRKFDAKY